MTKFQFNIRSTLILASLLYLAYFLLLHDTVMHSSISSIISYSDHVAIKERLLIMGLLPIYIAIMIFGSIVLGVYLSSKLEFLRQRCTIKK